MADDIVNINEAKHRRLHADAIEACTDPVENLWQHAYNLRFGTRRCSHGDTVNAIVRVLIDNRHYPRTVHGRACCDALLEDLHKSMGDGTPYTPIPWPPRKR